MSNSILSDQSKAERRFVPAEDPSTGEPDPSVLKTRGERASETDPHKPPEEAAESEQTRRDP